MAKDKAQAQAPKTVEPTTETVKDVLPDMIPNPADVVVRTSAPTDVVGEIAALNSIITQQKAQIEDLGVTLDVDRKEKTELEHKLEQAKKDLGLAVASIEKLEDLLKAQLEANAKLAADLYAATPAAEVKSLGGPEVDWEVSVPGASLPTKTVKACHASQAIEAYKTALGVWALPSGATAVRVPPAQE